MSNPAQETIQPGQPIPAVKVTLLEQGKLDELSTAEFFRGKKVVLFGVPGAFTPTCSDRHLPSFLDHADELHALGVDEIACTSVNDHYVLEAWGASRGVGKKIRMLADGNGDFACALGLVSDSRPWGLGFRSRRYAAIVEDGVVSALFVDSPGRFEVSGAEQVLAELSK